MKEVLRENHNGYIWTKLITFDTTYMYNIGT